MNKSYHDKPSKFYMLRTPYLSVEEYQNDKLLSNNSPILESILVSSTSLYDALQNTDMAHVKQSLLHHLDQQLGSWFKDGKQLSGGEWIRIGIGRAIARNATMYILDEPNSSLDVIAETEVFKSFKDMMADKIGLVITHRISSIKVMGGDILVLHEGEMVGQGKHEELILGCPIYGVLYNNSVRQEL